MNRLCISLAGFLFIAPLVSYGQSQQGTSDQTSVPTLKSTSEEVVLDMVFRDKKGRTVRDVRPEEIHVLENGVEQKLRSFQLVQGNAVQELNVPTSAVQPPPLDPLREVRLVTLVFENLDAEGKQFFRGAVKDLLEMAPEQNLYFSVMTVDQKLHLIQPFTADHAALLKSLDKAKMWSFTQYSNQTEQFKSELKQVVSSDEPQLQGGAGGGPSPSQVQGTVNWRMAKMQYDMLQAADMADREQGARGTLDALLSLVQGQSELPGRKVVLYFNSWLMIPEVLKDEYASLISAANRANISFYTVDAKGLVTWSQSGGGRDLLTDANKDVRDFEMKGGVGPVTPGQARAADEVIAATRSNPLLWLRDLAQKTGGATIAETNDLRAPLRTAMDEIRTYYEATYAPHIAVYDGKFRTISVRVDRPDVVVHTRSGYFALPQVKSGQQLYAYEMPLLKAINSASPPADIHFNAVAERFNDHGPKIEYMVTFEAPLAGLGFTPKPEHKTAAVDAALLAIIKNSQGEVVGKFSKDFAVEVPIDKIEAYKAGNMVQTFRTELAPGAYFLEAVVMDRNGKKLGVKKSSLTVPEPSSKLSISDVVVVRRTDALKDNQILDAFYFPGGKVVPTLTSTLKGGPGNVLPFYFAVYPDRASKDPVKLTMAFYKEGQYLGAAEAPLPAIEPDGRIPYIANLPADKFTPGAYQIRIGVTQGSSKAEENIAFQVEQ
ncbi:MAG: VWA domain-containing protein [Terriglobales bacterium]